MRAQIVLFDGFDPMDVVGPFEVLSAGAQVSDGAVTVDLVSAEGAREVSSGLPGFALAATAMLDPESAGLVVVPGAAGPVEGAPSAGDPNAGDPTIAALLARAVRTDLGPLIARALANPSMTVATVCGGSLALAMAGLIQGRSAVTHGMGLAALGAAGVDVVRARVVDDGNLVSAGGVTSGIDLGLYLLERELGPRVAVAVEQLFEFERRGTVWRAVGRQVVPA